MILGQSISSYESEYKKSLQNPTDYWGKVAEDIVWTKKWDQVLDNTTPPFTKVFQYIFTQFEVWTLQLWFIN